MLYDLCNEFVCKLLPTLCKRNDYLWFTTNLFIQQKSVRPEMPTHLKWFFDRSHGLRRVILKMATSMVTLNISVMYVTLYSDA